MNEITQLNLGSNYFFDKKKMYILNAMKSVKHVQENLIILI